MRTHLPHQRDRRWGPTSRVPQLAGCAECGAPAEIVPWHRRSSLRTPEGSVRSCRVRGHWSLLGLVQRVLQNTR